jgi:phage repressor protein C with HTH and peptisase S24 domain
MTALVSIVKTNSQAKMFVSSIVAQACDVFDTSHMQETDADPPIYRALIALKPPSLKLGTWAKEAGLARNAFNGIRAHGNPTNTTLQALLKVIGASMSDLSAHTGSNSIFDDSTGTATVLTEVRRADDRAIQDRRTAYHVDAPMIARTIPVLGTAVGGEHGSLDEDIELTELHLGEVVDQIARPQSLANDDSAYALTVVGDSMSPRYEPGEIVIVSPRWSIAIGSDVIVQLRGPDGDGERIKMVLIKKLIRRTAGHVELAQYNPPMTFKVEIGRVAALHRCKHA